MASSLHEISDDDDDDDDDDYDDDDTTINSGSESDEIVRLDDGASIYDSESSSTYDFPRRTADGIHRNVVARNQHRRDNNTDRSDSQINMIDVGMDDGESMYDSDTTSTDDFPRRTADGIHRRVVVRNSIQRYNDHHHGGSNNKPPSELSMFSYDSLQSATSKPSSESSALLKNTEVNLMNEMVEEWCPEDSSCASEGSAVAATAQPSSASSAFFKNTEVNLMNQMVEEWCSEDSSSASEGSAVADVGYHHHHNNEHNHPDYHPSSATTERILVNLSSRPLNHNTDGGKNGIVSPVSTGSNVTFFSDSEKGSLQQKVKEYELISPSNISNEGDNDDNNKSWSSLLGYDDSEAAPPDDDRRPISTGSNVTFFSDSDKGSLQQNVKEYELISPSNNSNEGDNDDRNERLSSLTGYDNSEAAPADDDRRPWRTTSGRGQQTHGQQTNRIESTTVASIPSTNEIKMPANKPTKLFLIPKKEKRTKKKKDSSSVLKNARKQKQRLVNDHAPSPNVDHSMSQMDKKGVDSNKRFVGNRFTNDTRTRKKKDSNPVLKNAREQQRLANGRAPSPNMDHSTSRMDEKGVHNNIDKRVVGKRRAASTRSAPTNNASLADTYKQRYEQHVDSAYNDSIDDYNDDNDDDKAYDDTPPAEITATATKQVQQTDITMSALADTSKQSGYKQQMDGSKNDSVQSFPCGENGENENDESSINYKLTSPRDSDAYSKICKESQSPTSPSKVVPGKVQQHVQHHSSQQTSPVDVITPNTKKKKWSLLRLFGVKRTDGAADSSRATRPTEAPSLPTESIEVPPIKAESRPRPNTNPAIVTRLDSGGTDDDNDDDDDAKDTKIRKVRKKLVGEKRKKPKGKKLKNNLKGSTNSRLSSASASSNDAESDNGSSQNRIRPEGLDNFPTSTSYPKPDSRTERNLELSTIANTPRGGMNALTQTPTLPQAASSGRLKLGGKKVQGGVQATMIRGSLVDRQSNSMNDQEMVKKVQLKAIERTNSGHDTYSANTLLKKPNRGGTDTTGVLLRKEKNAVNEIAGGGNDSTVRVRNISSSFNTKVYLQQKAQRQQMESETMTVAEQRERRYFLAQEDRERRSATVIQAFTRGSLSRIRVKERKNRPGTYQQDAESSAIDSNKPTKDVISVQAKDDTIESRVPRKKESSKNTKERKVQTEETRTNSKPSPSPSEIQAFNAGKRGQSGTQLPTSGKHWQKQPEAQNVDKQVGHLTERVAQNFDLVRYLRERLEIEEIGRQMKSTEEPRHDRHGVPLRDLERHKAMKLQALIRGYLLRKRIDMRRPPKRGNAPENDLLENESGTPSQIGKLDQEEDASAQVKEASPSGKSWMPGMKSFELSPQKGFKKVAKLPKKGLKQMKKIPNAVFLNPSKDKKSVQEAGPSIGMKGPEQIGGTAPEKAFSHLGNRLDRAEAESQSNPIDIQRAKQQQLVLEDLKQREVIRIQAAAKAYIARRAFQRSLDGRVESLTESKRSFGMKKQPSAGSSLQPSVVSSFRPSVVSSLRPSDVEHATLRNDIGPDHASYRSRNTVTSASKDTIPEKSPSELNLRHGWSPTKKSTFDRAAYLREFREREAGRQRDNSISLVNKQKELQHGALQDLQRRQAIKIQSVARTYIVRKVFLVLLGRKREKALKLSHSRDFKGVTEPRSMVDSKRSLGSSKQSLVDSVRQTGHEQKSFSKESSVNKFIVTAAIPNKDGHSKEPKETKALTPPSPLASAQINQFGHFYHQPKHLSSIRGANATKIQAMVRMYLTRKTLRHCSVLTPLNSWKPEDSTSSSYGLNPYAEELFEEEIIDDNDDEFIEEEVIEDEEIIEEHEIFEELEIIEDESSIGEEAPVRGVDVESPGRPTTIGSSYEPLMETKKWVLPKTRYDEEDHDTFHRRGIPSQPNNNRETRDFEAGVERRDYRFSYLPETDSLKESLKGSTPSCEKSLKTYGDAVMAYYNLGDHVYDADDLWISPSLAAKTGRLLEADDQPSPHAMGSAMDLGDVVLKILAKSKVEAEPVRVPRETRTNNRSIVGRMESMDSWLPPDKAPALFGNTGVRLDRVNDDEAASSSSEDGWIPPTMQRLAPSSSRIDFTGSVKSVLPQRRIRKDEASTAWVPGATSTRKKLASKSKNDKQRDDARPKQGASASSTRNQQTSAMAATDAKMGGPPTSSFPSSVQMSRGTNLLGVVRQLRVTDPAPSISRRGYHSSVETPQREELTLPAPPSCTNIFSRFIGMKR